jgi:hypothetical protein
LIGFFAYGWLAADWRDSDVTGWYVYLQPKPGVSVYVNGEEIGTLGNRLGSSVVGGSGMSTPQTRRVLLTHGDRLVIGVTHYIRFHNPSDPDAQSATLADWTTVNEASPEFVASDVVVGVVGVSGG